MNILVFGSPFCGSTLLSGMLGSHSRIYSLGEVGQWYLWHRGDRPEPTYFRRQTLPPGFLDWLAECRLCGWMGQKAPCPVWDGAPGLDDPAGLYGKLRRHVNRDVLVDSSKIPDWYKHIIPECAEDHFVGVLLHKPVWAFVTSQARYAGLRSSADMAPEAIDASTELWCSYYRGFRDIIASGRPRTVVNLKYEDLAIDPAGSLRRVLCELQTELEYEPGMEFGFNNVRHEIAGNSKLRMNIERCGGHMPVSIDPGVTEASAAVRERILAHADARELMEWLGRGDELLPPGGGSSMRREFVIQGSPFPILNGTKWFLWPEKENPDFNGFVDATLVNSRHWDSGATQVVTAQCGPTGVCLDIGAHIGYYTVLLGRCVGPRGFVVGIEADATRFAVLERHIAANGINARAICRTLGDDFEADRAVIREAFAGRRINFIKTDVDGPDWKIWRMLEPIVAEHRPERLLFEVCDYTLQAVEGAAPYGQHCIDMCKLIASWGYELHDEDNWMTVVRPEEVASYKRSLHNSSVNLFGWRVR